MVANLSSHKRGWDDRWKEFSDWAEKGMSVQKNLLQLVDEDTDAFNKILEAYSLPNKSEEDKIARDNAIQDATKYAILIPFRVMETAFSAFELIREMVEKGNPSSVTDAGVGAMALRTSVLGAYMNVKINASGLKDRSFADEIIEKGRIIESESIRIEAEIISLLNRKISNLT
jgi:glutamate formiminotransferase/formiminotetrahydrofolate cyclodeaminase